MSYFAYLASFITVGSFVIIDLIAATTNALNGALLAQRPDYYRGKQWSVVGIIILRDLRRHRRRRLARRLAEQDPGRADESLVSDPVHPGRHRGDADLLQGGPEVPRDVLPVHDRFSLPWYAAIGVAAALAAGLPDIAAIAIGVVGPTAGRFLIDITAGKSAKQFVRGEWFVGTAVLTSIVYLVLLQVLGADAMAGDADLVCRWLPLPPRGDLVPLGRAPAACSR